MLLRQLEDVSILLDRLGIKHNITSGYSRGLVWGKYQQRLQYKIVINHGMAVNRFMELIGFVQERPFKKRGSPIKDITLLLSEESGRYNT